MKFLSLNYILEGTKQTFIRFPLVLVFAAFGTWILINFNHLGWSEQKASYALVNLTLICILAIPLLLSLYLWSESRQLKREQAIGINLLGVVFLIIYYFTLSPHLVQAEIYQYLLWIAAFHLLVSFSPFLFNKGDSANFWHYNQKLFIRFIISFIYSNTIFFGLLVALLACHHLLSIKINEKIYFDLWICVVGIFNTWFFLSGVPKRGEGYENYPLGLKRFTQFVLIPLVVLYAIILYAYMGKIIVTWTLPKGKLSIFILVASILGILTQLLIHPLRSNKDWIKLYSRYFYILLLPLIGLMAFAIWVRIDDYGITHERYLLLVFTLWLLIISIYFLLKPETHIKTIPITLFMLGVLANVGPWGAAEVSKKSQMKRFEQILIENSLLENGQFKKANDDIKFEERKEISSIVEYFKKTYTLDVLKKYIARPSDLREMGSWDFTKQFFNFEYTHHYTHSNTHFEFHSPDTEMLDIRHYDYLVPTTRVNIVLGKVNELKALKTSYGTFTLLTDQKGIKMIDPKGEEIVFDISSLAKSLNKKYDHYSTAIPTSEFIIEGKSTNYRAKLRIQSLNGNYDPQNLGVFGITFDLLIGKSDE